MIHKLLLISAAVTALLGGGVSRSALAIEQVQLKEFMVDAFSERKRRTGQLPITVFFDVKSKRQAKSLCEVAPRYREAILSLLGRTRYLLNGNGKLSMAAIRNDLNPVFKKVDGKKLILKAKIRQGLPKLKQSAALYFNRAGCMRVN